MKLRFDSDEECRAVAIILDSFERQDDEDKIFDPAIEQMRIAIDRYRIGGSYDLIGVVKCPECQKKWTAICSKNAPKLRCPRCNAMVKVPEVASS